MAAYAALVSLMNIIDELQFHPRPPISIHKHQVESLAKKLTFLQDFLQDYNSHLGYSTAADPLESRIADAAYTAEDLIESHIVDQIRTTINGKRISPFGFYEGLEEVVQEMSSIEKEAMEIKETMGVQHQLHPNSSPPNSLRSTSIAHSSSMVGVDDLLFQMKDRLTSACCDLQIIPIVGMGGTGKTTLAKHIYQDPLIKQHHFHVCAWATISQEYSFSEILTQVLCELSKEVSQHSSKDINVLGEMLHKHLWGRRYLIIMDDIWNIEAWDGVRRFFPDNKNGSRIVMTTRLSNLASVLTCCKSLAMRFLDDTSSWDLLSKVVFGGEESCSLELEEIGKRIGKGCKGLPLSIVVIGGCLAKSKHTRELWDHIEENLNSIVNSEDDECCLQILHMSYNQLPIYLKPCFLYIGVFPEDKAIRVSKLIKLWVAEGFLKPVTGKNLEDTARDYLKDLIDRNLVLIHEVGSTGNIKYCRIHDLLRDLCLREAEKERFYHVVAQHTPQGILIHGQRRIVICSSTSQKQVVDELGSMSVARSLIWDLPEGEYSLYPAPMRMWGPPLYVRGDDNNLEGLVKFSLHEVVPSLSSRLLRILSTSTSKAAHSLENVLQLVNSRYLDISTARLKMESHFPSSIHLLWNLQTLIVEELEGITAPTEIWDMPQIRHVQFPGLCLPDPPSGRGGIVLGNLQTLVTIKDLKCSEEVVKRIPNIKKLRVSKRSCGLNNLGRLQKLESFGYYAFSKSGLDSLHSLNFPHSLHSLDFPHSLKKLSLQIGYWQCWQVVLGKIGGLPLLEKLKLCCGHFGGSHWETSEGQFRRLKYLEIHDCDELKLWTTESAHFPCLEHLVLQRLCLNEIPLDFAEIPTLGLIEVKFCGDSAAISGKRIVEEQEALYGEVGLQVQVMVTGKNEALESLATPNFRVQCLY